MVEKIIMEEETENSSNSFRFAISVILTLVGCLLSTVGLIWMKLAHDKVQIAKNKGQKVNTYCNMAWIGGFISLIIGSVLNVLALGFGNAILLSSSSSFSVIFNMIFSVIILKEKVL